MSNSFVQFIVFYCVVHWERLNSDFFLGGWWAGVSLSPAEQRAFKQMSRPVCSPLTVVAQKTVMKTKCVFKFLYNIQLYQDGKKSLLEKNNSLVVLQSFWSYRCVSMSSNKKPLFFFEIFIQNQFLGLSWDFSKCFIQNPLDLKGQWVCVPPATQCSQELRNWRQLMNDNSSVSPLPAGYRCQDKSRPCENGGTCLDSPFRCM